MPPGPSVKTLPSLILFLILLTAGLAGLEFLHRVLHRHLQSFNYVQADRELGWAPIPGFKVPDHPFGNVVLNKLGLRSPEINPQKKSILLLGDSVAWGFGTSNENSESWLLTQTSPPDYQILNLAVPGYGTDQEYLRLKKLFPRLPHVQKAFLIIYTNDIQDVGSNVFDHYRKPFFFYDQNQQLSVHKIAPWDLRYLISQTSFLDKLLNQWTPLRDFYGRVSGDRYLSKTETEKVFTGLLTAIKQYLKERQVETIFVLSPARKDFPAPSQDFLRIESLLGKLNISFINLYEELKGRDITTLYGDEAHYTPQGNKLVAGILSKSLAA